MLSPSCKGGMKRATNYNRLILILGLLTTIGPLSIDMYLPAFPAIAHSLHTSVAQVMLSLSSFFIGISAGQLVYGPLLERFGRKKPLYAGLCIYVLASAGCAFAASIEWLIAFRFLQALGSCAGMVASRAMVRDLFAVSENARVFSSLMLVVAVSPIIAPTLGGYITSVLGWRFVFGTLTVISIGILAAVVFLLPESRKPDPTHSLRVGNITRSFVEIMRHPQFATYAFTGAVAYSGLYAYLSGSPYVFMELFHLNEKQYGWVFAVIAAGIIGASQVNRFVVKQIRSEQIIKYALWFQCLTGTALFALTLTGQINLALTIVLVFLYLCCQGFTFPNASALCLAPFGHRAGSASALMGAVQMGVGAGASALVSIIQNHTALPMAGVMAGCSLLASVIYFFGNRIIVRRATSQALDEEDINMVSEM